MFLCYLYHPLCILRDILRLLFFPKVFVRVWHMKCVFCTVSVFKRAVCLLSGLCETACVFVPVCVRPSKYAEGVVCHCVSVSLPVMTISQWGRSRRGDREKHELEGRWTAKQLLKDVNIEIVLGGLCLRWWGRACFAVFMESKNQELLVLTFLKLNVASFFRTNYNATLKGCKRHETSLWWRAGVGRSEMVGRFLMR